MIKKSTYMLYGTQLISDDSTLRTFAESVGRNVPTEDIKDLEKDYYEGFCEDCEFEDEFMKRVREILEYDIVRTDIDYESLMKKYAPEIGPLLYELDNHGTDLTGFPIAFFGDAARESFNLLVENKVRHIKFGFGEV